MCRVIAVSNQKGGVGKTVSCVNLGIGLAQEGKKVLLIDADPQGSLTISLGYEEPDEMEYSLATLMMNIVNDEKLNIEKTILHHKEGVDLIPANIELSAIEVSLVNAMSRELILRSMVDRLREFYDYIIIDCMPSLGMMTINALACADSVLIPVQAAYLPLLTLLWSIFCIIRKKKRECFIAGLLICSVLNAFTAASVAALTNKYYLTLGGGTLNQYLLFVVIDLLFFICAFIYLTSGLIVAWKVKSPEHRYKGENLFFFGQIISKLNTTSKTMTLICITLVLAIFMFIAAPILTGWASGYLDMRSMYDVQVYSRYNDVYEEENLPQNSYEIITDFLTEHKIDTDYDCTFNLYLPEKDDFHNRQKYDFPIVAISLSDYNTIREMLGYEQISLEEDEFTTQWKAIATEEERDSFLKEHTSIMTDAGELTLSGQSYYEDPIGETAYNSYTNVLYVLPDNICEKLLPVIKNRYITTTENISYENARKLEKLFTEKYPEQAETGAIYGVRFSTLQINSSIANNFILQTAMIYGAVVLMVICLTVLSLQQLLDAGQYKYRFSVLRKLGVEEKHIGKLILQQLSVWFGLPIITAIIVAAVVIAYFIQTISAEISAYIGFSTLMLQIGATMGILAILLICYFISTWIIFRSSVNP